MTHPSPIKINMKDPTMQLILSEDPRRVFELKASELIERFPDLKEEYSLHEQRSRRNFGNFWSSLRTNNLAMLKSDVNAPSLMKMTRNDPLIKKILSEGPHILTMTAGELTALFPALKEQYRLQERLNRNRFGKFWTGLRRSALAKLQEARPMKMSQNDPLIKKILSEGPYVLTLTACDLIALFPALKAAYSLQDPYSLKRFGTFWFSLRGRRLAKLKRLENNATVPASAAILPRPETEGKPQDDTAVLTNIMRPDEPFIKFLCEDRRAFEVLPDALIEQFPLLIEHFKLEELDNKARFAKFWDGLRTSKFEEYKSHDDQQDTAPSSESTVARRRPPIFPPPVLFRHLPKGSETPPARRPIHPDRPPSDPNHPLYYHQM